MRSDALRPEAFDKAPIPSRDDNRMGLLYQILIAPFVDFPFMRRALVAGLALSIACGPVGSFLVQRRLSLIGYALSHAVLPGAALGYLMFGASVLAMSVGGLVAGIAVTVLSGLLSRMTVLREDANFTALYNIAIAAGVVIVSLYAANTDIVVFLFGNILAIDDASLLLVAGIASISSIAMAVIYRPLVTECLDAEFLRSVDGRGAMAHAVFMILVVLDLVGSFQALGTLMAVGLLFLPAIAARFLVWGIWPLCLASIGLGIVASYGGLVLSFHLDLASGPTIVLAAGFLCIAALLTGGRGGLLRRQAR
jgi:zinc/manganese transport system permease protein